MEEPSPRPGSTTAATRRFRVVARFAMLTGSSRFKVAGLLASHAPGQRSVEVLNDIIVRMGRCFWGRFDDEVQRSIFQVAQLRSVQAGDVLYSKHDEADSYYYVIRGAVKLTQPVAGAKRGDDVVRMLRAGDDVGHHAVLRQGEQCLTGAEAAEDSVLLVVERSALEELGSIEDILQGWQDKVDFLRRHLPGSHTLDSATIDRVLCVFRVVDKRWKSVVVGEKSTAQEVMMIKEGSCRMQSKGVWPVSGETMQHRYANLWTDAAKRFEWVDKLDPHAGTVEMYVRGTSGPLAKSRLLSTPPSMGRAAPKPVDEPLPHVHTVAVVGPGEFLGWSSVFWGRPEPFEVVADEDLELWVASKEDLEKELPRSVLGTLKESFLKRNQLFLDRVRSKNRDWSVILNTGVRGSRDLARTEGEEWMQGCNFSKFRSKYGIPLGCPLAVAPPTNNAGLNSDQIQRAERVAEMHRVMTSEAQRRGVRPPIPLAPLQVKPSRQKLRAGVFTPEYGVATPAAQRKLKQNMRRAALIRSQSAC